MAARTRAAAWAVDVPLSVVRVALLEPRSVARCGRYAVRLGASLLVGPWGAAVRFRLKVLMAYLAKHFQPNCSRPTDYS